MYLLIYIYICHYKEVKNMKTPTNKNPKLSREETLNKSTK